MVLAALTGCGTTAPPRTFSLLPPPSAEPAPLPSGGRPATPVAVEVDAVAVPPAVDQPQWLVRLPDQQLVLLEQTQWASPLRDEYRAALRGLLARRWAVSDARPPVWRLHVELSHFESVLGRQARLEGRWTLQPGSATAAAGAQAISCALRIHEPAGFGLRAMAEAHRRAAQRLADQIGPMLRVSASTPAPACPALDG